MKPIFPSLFALAVVAAGCSSGSGASISCYVANQQICYEDPTPTTAQLDNLPVKCSSDSGQYLQPAACPKTGFIGKCTFNASDGLEVDRFYAGVDPVYQQSFCETVALGTWSTTF